MTLGKLIMYVCHHGALAGETISPGIYWIFCIDLNALTWCLFSKSASVCVKRCRALFHGNRIRFNRHVLRFMATLGVIPFHFGEDGRRISRKISKVRLAFWKTLLFVSIVYSFYINVMLIQSLLTTSLLERDANLGIHITRALLSVTCNFWAYELFRVHRDGATLLYNFAQENPGKGLYKHWHDSCS